MRTSLELSIRIKARRKPCKVTGLPMGVRYAKITTTDPRVASLIRSLMHMPVRMPTSP